MSRCEAVLRLPAAGRGQAEPVSRAMRPDDDAFVTTRLEADVVVAEIRASNVRSLLRAVDDILANASVSEDLLRALPLDDDSA